MNEITKTITVDLFRRGSARIVFARQNDLLSRRILINLTSLGEPYHVPMGTSVTLNVLRADGNSAAFVADVLPEGQILVTLSLWTLSVAGETRCSVTLVDSEGKKLTGDDFYLDVLEALYTGDEIFDDPNYSLLTGLLARVSAFEEDELSRAEAEILRRDAERERASAENERVQAEESRIIDERLRVQEEAQRQNAENSRNQSEMERDNGETERQIAENERKIAENERGYAESARQQTMAEIVEQFGGMERTVQQISEKCDAMGGIGGEIAIKPSDFDSELFATVSLAGVGTHDSVTVTPKTAADRDEISRSGLFIAPVTDGGRLMINAICLPKTTISLVYFISRGHES